MPDAFLDQLARLLISHSARVRPGDLVSLAGPPLTERLIVGLYREALLAGGHPVVMMAPEDCAEMMAQYGSADQLTFPNPLEELEANTVNVAIQVLAPRTPRTMTWLDGEKWALRQQARRPLLDRFLDRASRQELRWTATLFPCPAAAREAGMPLAEYEAFLFRAGLFDHADPAAAWLALSERQARLIDYLQGTEVLRVWTSRGTDLRLHVGGRTWINGDGRRNFPDGEVFTAPWEEATDGVVVFDFPLTLGGQAVVDARLVFRAGRVVEATAQRGEESLHRLLDHDAGARVLGEVAFGCNYAITRYTHHPLLDEKIGGTFHLALGASFPECGGRNQSALHCDLVGDLRPDGRVEADGKAISVGGRFLDADWPQAAFFRTSS